MRELSIQVHRTLSPSHLTFTPRTELCPPRTSPLPRAPNSVPRTPHLPNSVPFASTPLPDADLNIDRKPDIINAAITTLTLTMNTFQIALTNVLVTIACIVPGFVLCKCRRAVADHIPTISAILIYIGTPFLELTSFASLRYEPGHLAQMGLFFVISLAAQLAFCLGFYLIAGKKRTLQPTRVVNVAAVLGNVGYFGLPLIRAILPGNALALCCATMFIVSMNIVTFTVGVYLLTGDRLHISVRSALINPATIGLMISVPFYFFGWGNYLPTAVTSMASNIAGMTAPLCMFVVGIRLAGTDFKALFVRGNAYLAALLKLIAFPLFCWLLTWPISRFLPLQPELRLTLVVLAATPCASHTLNFSELYGVNPDLAANCILISTILCFATLPAFTLLPM